ncbi:extracellular solute-binding protein [Paenibacillus cymbidii]|uniref:extracellular solute-binding protein n=1 Tax=Paenibacillus cymbidii TaxID=1639034 RepID=UPI001080E9D8|nr:extracellular solute-binding protein [Paenibacillus cymbidii]
MKKKATQRGLWTLTAVAAAVAVAGCSGNGGGGSSDGAKDTGKETGKEQQAPANLNTSGYPIVKEPLTLKMMGPKAPIHGPWEQMDLFTEMEKRTGIKFTFDTPASESYQTKKNLAFASGEVPDVFFSGPLTANDEVVYGQQQHILIPLEGLIDKYAPNLRQILQQYPEVRSAVTLPDGHIYSLPRINNVTRDLAPTKLWINKKWLDKLGLQPPKTTDELYEALKAFKTKDPNGNGKADEIPLTSIKIGDLRPMFLAAFGELNGGSGYISLIGTKLNFYPTQPGYKEMLVYLNKLYKEGLLDNETFAQSSQQLNAKGNSGVLGVVSASGGAFTAVGTDRNDDYTMIAPLTSPANQTAMYPQMSSVTRGLFSITGKNKAPEATMRWIDYFYSDEGSVLAVFGKENEGWKWLDAGKTQWERLTPNGMQPEEYRGGKVTPDAGTAVPTIRKQDFLAKRANTGQIGQVDKEVDDKIVKVWKPVYPLVYFNEAQQNRISALEADMKPYIEQMEGKFITGSEPLDNWGKYVETLKKMGVDEYMKIHQDAYDVWSKTKK